MTDILELTESPFYTERVHCCVCNGTGKLPKLAYWTKDCSVCDGSGKRVILMAKNLSPDDAAMVRASAIHGSLNYQPHSQLGNALGFPLF